MFLGWDCLSSVNTTGGAGPWHWYWFAYLCPEMCVLTEGTSIAMNTISGRATSREVPAGWTERLLEGISGPGVCVPSAAGAREMKE